MGICPHFSRHEARVSTAPRPSQSTRSSTSSRFSAMVFLCFSGFQNTQKIRWLIIFLPHPSPMKWREMAINEDIPNGIAHFLGKPNDVGSTRRVSNKMTRPDVGLLSIENRDSTYTTIRKQKTGISCIIYIRTIIYI